MELKFFSDEVLYPEPVSVCKGLIFRGKRNAFINGRGEYVYQERMYPLKKKSCTGCNKCGWYNEMLEEDIGNGILPIISHVEHNALYKLEVVNINKDWETSIVDDYDLEFIRIK